MTVFSALIVALWPMLLPWALVVFSVRIPARSTSVNSVPEMSLRIASAKVSVMLPDTSFVAVPSSGLNSGDGAVVSTVNVALAAVPPLDAAS